MQYAIDHVPAGSTVALEAGTYAPFVVRTKGVTVRGIARNSVIVAGAPGVSNVVELAANSTTVTSLTVSGCVPNPDPAGFENDGSSSVRVDSAARNATVSDLLITDGVGTNSFGRPFGCYGVYIAATSAATVTGNEITGQGYGVFAYHGGGGYRITSNVIHDNHAEIRDTPAPNDDFGAVGVGFFDSSATPGPVVSGNTIYDNIAPSADYVTDGGGFEIFQSSNVTMSTNTLYNNENVIETGTGSASAPCVDNVFTGNTVSGRTAGSTLQNSKGLILRCATDMQITSNSLTGLSPWVFEIGGVGGWAGSVSGLSITGNRVVQGGDHVFALLPTGTAKQPSVPTQSAGISIDHNTYRFSGAFASDATGRTLSSFANWQQVTGFDRASTAAAG